MNTKKRQKRPTTYRIHNTSNSNSQHQHHSSASSSTTASCTRLNSRKVRRWIVIALVITFLIGHYFVFVFIRVHDDAYEDNVDVDVAGGGGKDDANDIQINNIGGKSFLSSSSSLSSTTKAKRRRSTRRTTTTNKKGLETHLGDFLSSSSGGSRNGTTTSTKFKTTKATTTVKDNSGTVRRHETTPLQVVSTTFRTTTPPTTTETNQKKKKDHDDSHDDSDGDDDLSKYYFYPTSSTPAEAGVTATRLPQPPPKWFQEYLSWHQQARMDIDIDIDHQNINTNYATKYKKYNYLVMRCLRGDKCGGAADRLLPVLTLVKIAASTKRIFLIYWERPSSLETFLVPPIDGLDWRIPKYLSDIIFHPTISDYTMRLDKIISKCQDVTSGTNQFVRTKYQSYNYGSDYYNQLIQYEYNNQKTKQKQQQQTPEENQDEEDDTSRREEVEVLPPPLQFEDVFVSIWYKLFTPSVPVVKRLYEKLSQLRLIPKQYVATHFRAYRTRMEPSNTTLQYMTQNALDCTSHFLLPTHNDDYYNTNQDHVSNDQRQQRQVPLSAQIPPSSIYYASDAPYTYRIAIDYGREHNVRVVVSSPDPNNRPLHFEKDSTTTGSLSNTINTTVASSDFYDTFVDLYLLSLSKCVIRGRGGYGLWGSMISVPLPPFENTRLSKRCDFQHQTSTQQIGCEWKEQEPQQRQLNNQITDEEGRNGDKFPSYVNLPPLFVAPMTARISTTGSGPSTASSSSEEALTQTGGTDTIRFEVDATNSQVNTSKLSLPPPKLETLLDQFFTKKGHSYNGDLWELSQWIPQWMKGKSNERSFRTERRSEIFYSY